MRPTVRIAFNLALAGAGDFFTLDDPVRGVLDNATFALGGEVLTDVSTDVRSVSLRRGRSSETSVVDAGSGTVTLDNRLRLYDPLASASISPYAPSILPRKQVTVEIGPGRQFTGIVEDWDLQYSQGGDSVALVKLTDGLTLLNEEVLASGPSATGLSGSIIYDTAASANWPMARTAIDAGTAFVGAHEIQDGTVALQYMQKISNTEQGLLFINKDGLLTFRDRTSPRRVMGTLFSDQGNGIPFRNIEIIYGTEFLYTEIDVEYLSGSVTAVETSLASASAIANYGNRTLNLSTFLPDASSASAIGSTLAERYGEPTLRIVSLQVEMNGLPIAQQNQMLMLEIGDGVDIEFTPNGIGEGIFRELAVDEIKHEISPGAHVMTLHLFEPVLLRREGFVSGTSSTAGSVTGFVGFFGSATGSTNEPAGVVVGVYGAQGFTTGSSGTAGTVVGVYGAQGSASGSSGTAGTVTGTQTLLTQFTLNTSQLDGPDTLG